MASVILYGAGQNARENIRRWREEGLNPVCIAEGDIKKQHTLMEGLEILSLVEAITKYPDYILYCTQASFNLPRIKQYLIGVGIPKERIKSCEGEGGSGGYIGTLYPQLHQLYTALQDELSRQWFMGRVEYSLSHNLSSIYRTMLSDENIEWVKNKKTYAWQRYEQHGLWEILKENYPVQKNKLYVMIFDEEWNEFDWVVNRFLEAMPNIGIKIEACIITNEKNTSEEYKGISCIKEQEFFETIDEQARIIIGFPGWSLEMKDVLKRYEQYRNIMYPIADTAHPQYIENDIFIPEEDEVYVDVGVYDLQNSMDFIDWAEKGFKKIYAFEPDPRCFKMVSDRLGNMDIKISSKIKLINKGLSNKNGVLEFPAEYKGSGKADGQFIYNEVVTLDSYLEGEKVTFVKMDVEGAEMGVLQGMKETILTHTPKLAICIYHKYEDVLDIMSYIIGLVPEYKFYIRHYNSNETETVLFAKVTD